MKSLIASLAFVLASSIGSAEQEAGWPQLRRGTQVKLMVEGAGPMRIVAGRLLASDAASVTVRTREGELQRLSRDQLFHLEYRSPGRDRKKGAKIGAIVTGVAGFVACAVLVERELDRTQPNRGNGQGAGMFCGLAGGLAAAPGYAVGRMIGAPGARWNPASPAALTVTR